MTTMRKQKIAAGLIRPRLTPEEMLKRGFWEAGIAAQRFDTHRRAMVEGLAASRHY